jgi:hypothetical protein
MSERPAAKSRAAPKKGKDPYLGHLRKAWPTILRAYDDFKDLDTIIEYQLRQGLVCAYPALDYIRDLTNRTRAQTRREYREATAAGKFMIFVRDTKDRVLRSYVFPIEKP